ncbi:MAG: hypothetical protein HOP28_00970 [Gemmatimonadales bacterium]|nr:hypothetical protein [Gemmatimonadales bacterium]
MRPLVGSLALAALLLFAERSGAVSVAAAQSRIAADSVVDRIVAVVGAKAILASNIEERILQQFPQGKGLPTTPEGLRALRSDLVRALVNEELMVQAAEKDTSIKILPDDITKSVDLLVKTTRSRFASEEEYRKDLRVSGFGTPDEYRNWLSEQQKRTLMIRELMSKQQSAGKLKPVAPTEKELRDYFDRNHEQFPKRSAALSFRQIIVAPPPKPDAKARALTLADSILQEVRKGADFAAAARRFSMDPGSKDQGGSLGWMRRGTPNIDSRFEEAAFSLRPGVVSDPVESSFGYHLIQVERTQPAEVQVRHILILPAVDSTDADSAFRAIAKLRELVVAGASFDSLQSGWTDRAEERSVDDFPIENLPQAYTDALNGIEVGKVSQIFKLDPPGDPVRGKFAFVLVTKRIPAGDVRYEDVKEEIRNGLADQLTQQRYIDKLRRATLVEIRTG